VGRSHREGFNAQEPSSSGRNHLIRALGRLRNNARYSMALDRGLQIPIRRLVRRAAAKEIINYMTLVAHIQPGKSATVEYAGEGRSRDTLDACDVSDLWRWTTPLRWSSQDPQLVDQLPPLSKLHGKRQCEIFARRWRKQPPSRCLSAEERSRRTSRSRELLRTFRIMGSCESSRGTRPTPSCAGTASH